MTSEVYPLHTFHKWAYAIRRQKEEEGKEKREKIQEFSYFHEITSSIYRKHPSRHWYRKLKNLVSIAYFDITLDSVSLKNKHYESSTTERQEIWQALTDVIKLSIQDIQVSKIPWKASDRSFVWLGMSFDVPKLSFKVFFYET